MAFDTSGNLYVACEYSVNVYAPGKVSTLRIISNGVHHPRALAFDASQNLYVVNHANSTVSVYAPGGSSPSKMISQGVSVPYALAFDGQENLYVANWLVSTVTVYAAGNISPFETISKGLASPDALAIDRDGYLYVADENGGGSRNTGYVTVYAPNGTTPLRKLSKSIAYPDALAIDGIDHLYVAGGGVAAYAPRGRKLSVDRRLWFAQSDSAGLWTVRCGAHVSDARLTVSTGLVKWRYVNTATLLPTI